MGQTTRLIVENPAAGRHAEGVFEYCRKLIGVKKRHRFYAGPDRGFPGNHVFAMQPDQGLPIILTVLYAPGGRLIHELPGSPDGSVEVSLDQGNNRSHDKYRQEIGAWLTAQGWRWQWWSDDGPVRERWQRG